MIAGTIREFYTRDAESNDSWVDLTLNRVKIAKIMGSCIL